jgi:hypothetical protein
LKRREIYLTWIIFSKNADVVIRFLGVLKGYKLTVNRHIAENSFWTKCRNFIKAILPKIFSKNTALLQNAENLVIHKMTILGW